MPSSSQRFIKVVGELTDIDLHLHRQGECSTGELATEISAARALQRWHYIPSQGPARGSRLRKATAGRRVCSFEGTQASAGTSSPQS